MPSGKEALPCLICPRPELLDAADSKVLYICLTGGTLH